MVRSLGAKAPLAEMTSWGFPCCRLHHFYPGCRFYLDWQMPPSLEEELEGALGWLELGQHSAWRREGPLL